MNEHLDAFDQVRRTAIDLGMNFGPKVLVAVIILVAGYFAGRWVGKLTGRSLARIELEPPVRHADRQAGAGAGAGAVRALALQNLGIRAAAAAGRPGCARGRHRARHARRAGQCGGRAHHHLHQAIPRRRVRLHTRRGRRCAHDLAVQHDARPSRPLAGGDPQPQDRRRDPAQLRADPPARHRRGGGLQHRSEPGARPRSARSCSTILAC